MSAESGTNIAQEAAQLAGMKQGVAARFRELKYYIPEDFFEPTYTADYSRNTMNLKMIRACFVLAVVFVAMRLYVRGFILRSFGKDDAALAITFVLYVTLCVIAIIAHTDYYAGWHTIDVVMLGKDGDGLKIAQLGFTYHLIYLGASFCIKTSILLFLRRLMVTPFERRLILGIGIFLIPFYISNIFAFAFQCNPASDFWNLASAATRGAKCISKYVIHYAFPLINAITDLVIWALPFPALYKVKMQKREKMVLLVLFGLGLIAVAASFLPPTATKSYGDETDPVYSSSLLFLFVAIEICFAIVCPCIPLIRPLLKHHFPSLVQTTSSSSNQKHSQSSTFKMNKWPTSSRSRRGEASLPSMSESTEKISDPEAYQNILPREQRFGNTLNHSARVAAGRKDSRANNEMELKMGEVLVTREFRSNADRN